MKKQTFDTNNTNNYPKLLKYILQFLNTLNSKIKGLEEGGGSPTASDLDSVLTAGNTSPDKSIELGGYQQSGSFRTFVNGLFGIFSTTISPNLIEFEDQIVKTNLRGSSGMNEEVNLQLPNEDGTLAVRERIVLENSFWENEVVTGKTWIDGKNIYKIVLPFTFNVNGFTQIDLSIYDIDTPISNNAILNSTTGKLTEFNSDYRLGFFAQVHDFESRFYYDGGLFIYVGYRVVTLATSVSTTTQGNRTGYLILEYTKNTEPLPGGPGEENPFPPQEM